MLVPLLFLIYTNYLTEGLSSNSRLFAGYIFRSSHPEVFLRKGVLKICSKFTGEDPCRSVVFRVFGMGVLL